MSWMEQIGGMLQRYVGANPAQPPAGIHNDFEQAAQAAPQSDLADGLATAFRSHQTPPFPQMLSYLFSQSNPQQRAGILNQLLQSVGPGILGSSLGSLLRGGQTQITPEQAQQVTPEAVQHIATEAEQSNPSVVDSISHFYSEHPTLIKTLGGAALAIVLARMAERNGA